MVMEHLEQKKREKKPDDLRGQLMPRFPESCNRRSRRRRHLDDGYVRTLLGPQSAHSTTQRRRQRDGSSGLKESRGQRR